MNLETSGWGLGFLMPNGLQRNYSPSQAPPCGREKNYGLWARIQP
jgi:hypothetical protein